MIHRRSLFLAAVMLASMPNIAAAEKKPKMTPMELQAMQTKEFETSKDVLFASVVSVLQDIGYQLDNADLPSGFITASSATVNKTSFLDALARQAGSGNTRVTAFVEQIGSRTRVRLNFLNSKTSSGIYGTSKNDKPVLDLATYAAAWEKIDEAVFVRSASSSTTPVKPPAPTVATGPAVTPAR